MNISEELHRLDKKAIEENTEFHDLRNLYEAAKLTAQDRSELKRLLNSTDDPSMVVAFLQTKEQEKNEELDEDISLNEAPVPDVTKYQQKIDTTRSDLLKEINDLKSEIEDKFNLFSIKYNQFMDKYWKYYIKKGENLNDMISGEYSDEYIQNFPNYYYSKIYTNDEVDHISFDNYKLHYILVLSSSFEDNVRKILGKDFNAYYSDAQELYSLGHDLSNLCYDLRNFIHRYDNIEKNYKHNFRMELKKIFDRNSISTSEVGFNLMGDEAYVKIRTELTSNQINSLKDSIEKEGFVVNWINKLNRHTDKYTKEHRWETEFQISMNPLNKYEGDVFLRPTMTTVDDIELDESCKKTKISNYIVKYHDIVDYQDVEKSFDNKKDAEEFFNQLQSEGIDSELITSEESSTVCESVVGKKVRWGVFCDGFDESLQEKIVKKGSTIDNMVSDFEKALNNTSSDLYFVGELGILNNINNFNLECYISSHKYDKLDYFRFKYNYEHKIKRTIEILVNKYFPIKHSYSIELMGQVVKPYQILLRVFGVVTEMPALQEKIVKKGSKYQVQSEKGRNMGIYDNKADAEDRLKEVEMFKHMNEDVESGGYTINMEDMEDTLGMYLQWEGIIGYDDDILSFKGDYEGLEEFLEEEGIYGYTDPIYDILEGGDAYCSEMEESDFIQLCDDFGVKPYQNKAHGSKSSGKDANKDEYIKEWAESDYEVGKPMDPDDFSLFKHMGHDDGYSLTQKDFDKYFEYFEDCKYKDDELDEGIFGLGNNKYKDLRNGQSFIRYEDKSQTQSLSLVYRVNPKKGFYLIYMDKGDKTKFMSEGPYKDIAKAKQKIPQFKWKVQSEYRKENSYSYQLDLTKVLDDSAKLESLKEEKESEDLEGENYFKLVSYQPGSVEDGIYADKFYTLDVVMAPSLEEAERMLQPDDEEGEYVTKATKEEFDECEEDKKLYNELCSNDVIHESLKLKENTSSVLNLIERMKEIKTKDEAEFFRKIVRGYLKSKWIDSREAAELLTRITNIEKCLTEEVLDEAPKLSKKGKDRKIMKTNDVFDDLLNDLVKDEHPELFESKLSAIDERESRLKANCMKWYRKHCGISEDVELTEEILDNAALQYTASRNSIGVDRAKKLILGK